MRLIALVVFGLTASAQSVSVVSATGSNAGIAPDSLASVFAANIATTVQAAGAPPWPTSLGGVSDVTITDSMGTATPVSLIFVSPNQMNIWIPPAVAVGQGTLSFPPIGGGPALRTAPIMIQKTAPGIFSADGTGSGPAAATYISQVIGGPPATPQLTFICDAPTKCQALAINLGIDTPTYVSLYGTGIRGAGNVTVMVGNVQVEPSYAGPQLQAPGLDQVNVPIPLNLRGAGLSNVTITADGVTSNAVQIDIQ